MRWVWQWLAAFAFGVLALLPEPVQANPICTPFASGGTVTVFTQGSETYCVHSFTATGSASFTALHDLDVDYLIVGGGGGGGGITDGATGGAGGGGAGGMLEGMRALVAGTFPITVGQGGTGVSCGTNCNSNNANGGNSSFDGVIAFGGGRGAFVGDSIGAGGGSGGGGRLTSAGVGGAGTQGNDGGNGTGEAEAGTAGGAGGGGAGAAADTVANDQGTAGGAGRASSITGMSVVYAGGGGGGGFGVTGGAGGSGGGGAAPAARGAGGNAIAATGGGGGGATGSESGSAFNGGNGGSGIVVIRYLVPDLPQADAGPDQSVGSGASATLDGSASVPVGQISYSWSQTGGPGVTLTGVDTVSPSFSAPSLSACQSNVFLTFSLVVTDSFGRASTPDTVTITVTPPACQGGGTGGSEVNEYNDPNGEVTWRAHSFFGNDTLTLSEPTVVEYLIVGGGGGGGSRHGGGGGAGEFRAGNTPQLSAGSYPITIGAGGAGAANRNVPGVHGNPSSAFGVTARGGNPGRNGTTGLATLTSEPASGGGGSSASLLVTPHESGFGNPGGAGHTGSTGPSWTGGGGGGAGNAGVAGSETLAGAGGAGLPSAITGTEVFYAGGGGGGTEGPPGGTGGIGGGGAGGRAAAGQPATPNTGGGGGGGGFLAGGEFAAGAGGSGIVVARYVINTRPTANAGPDTPAVAFQEFTLDGTGTTDPDDNITSYLWQQIGGTTVDLSDTSAISPTFTPEQPANGAASETLTFRLTVTDEFGLSHTDEVTITLHAVAVLTASKAVSVFSEDGSGCDDFSATTPEEPEFPAAIPGACIQYTIIVENEGPAAAQNVTLTDELPANLSFQAADLDDNWGTGTNLVTPSVGCSGCDVTVEDGVINANTTATLTIRAIVN